MTSMKRSWDRKGLCSRRGCAPHSLFGLAQKENAPRPVEEKKAMGALRCSGPPRATVVGVSVPAPILPDLRARLGLLRFLQLPSRGGWCPDRRGEKPHLTSFSFRAFRFATRFPGGRRGRCPHRPVEEAPSTTGQRQRKEKLDVSQTSPGQRFPQGPDVSVPDFYKEVPAFPRRRQEVCACADRPAEHFFFSTGRGAEGELRRRGKRSPSGGFSF